MNRMIRVGQFLFGNNNRYKEGTVMANPIDNAIANRVAKAIKGGESSKKQAQSQAYLVVVQDMQTDSAMRRRELQQLYIQDYQSAVDRQADKEVIANLDAAVKACGPVFGMAKPK